MTSKVETTSWLDILYLFATVLSVGAVIAGILYSIKAISSAVNATKDNLAKKGVNVTKGGVSVKTSGRMDREQYIDATQRGLINAYKNSSVSRRPSDGASPKSSPSSPSLARTSSQSSLNVPDDKSKKKWSLKKTLSGSKH